MNFFMLNEYNQIKNLLNDFIPTKDNFLLIYDQLENIFNSSIRKIEGNCILVSQFGGIGDAILISGCLKSFKEHYSLPLIVTCHDYTEAIFKNNPYVDKIIPINKEIYKSKNFLSDLIDLIYINLWQKELIVKDAYHFAWAEENKAAGWLNFLCGCLKRIGYLENTGKSFMPKKLLDNYFEIDKYLINYPISYNNAKHMVDRYFHIIEEYLQINIKHEIYVWIDIKDKEYIKQFLKQKNIIINISAAIKSKRYPSNQINLVCKYLHETYPEYNLILIGGEDLAEESKNISYCLNLVGKLNLMQSIALINECNLYIGNDTGLTHAAAACKIPVMVFYKEAQSKENIYPEFLSSYVQFFPYKTKAVGLRPKVALSPCSQIKIIHSGCKILNQHHCIRGVTLDQVKEAINFLLH